MKSTLQVEHEKAASVSIPTVCSIGCSSIDKIGTGDFWNTGSLGTVCVRHILALITLVMRVESESSSISLFHLVPLSPTASFSALFKVTATIFSAVFFCDLENEVPLPSPP